MRRGASQQLVWLALTALAGSCVKAPITDINAGFELADATWFEEEQTLFVFYRLSAEQGLNPESTLELTYRTDDVLVPWTPLDQLPPVHEHLGVDCGSTRRCGSMSVKVVRPPRDVGLRLRYHRSGPLSLQAETAYNVVLTGPAHSNRSLVVYGVFDRSNTQVQWRARHQFPTVRNEDATALGLRRRFTISEPAFGALALPGDNPYGYGASPACPLAHTPLPWPDRTTSERAIFESGTLPLQASSAESVCAAATVSDAVGAFTTTAFARKNAETRPAFPLLRSPVREGTKVGFVLRVCDRVISQPHLEMQVQRFLLEGAPEICIEDFRQPGFSDRLQARLRERVDALRVLGKDMVLFLALHHDDTSGRLQPAVEAALAPLLAFERDKPSPRVSGAAVLDSLPWRIATPNLRPLVLWCPPPRALMMPDLDQIVPSTPVECPVQADIPELTFGPFRLTSLPILPTRQQYLTFIDRYSAAQAGSMKSITCLAPERTAVSENVQVGDFEQVTFFNNEVITAAPEDAFSFCSQEEPEEPLDGGLTPDAGPPTRAVDRIRFRPSNQPMTVPAPLEVLPVLHASAPSPAYTLGLRWESPFLFRAEYEQRVAATATIAVVTIPFGIATQNEEFLGARQWRRESFPIGDALQQCTRFCDHGTFDSAGVYAPRASFRQAYLSRCYAPRFPRPDDQSGGFPIDP